MHRTALGSFNSKLATLFLATYSGFGRFNKTCECFLVGDCHVSQNLAVEVDAFLLQTVNEERIAQAILAGACIDAGDPEASEITFALSSVSKGIAPCPHDCLVGGDEKSRFRAAKSFCVLEDFFVPLLQHISTFYSGHFYLLLGPLTGSGLV